MLICQGCGSTLTDDEAHYYGGRCETCEREAWQALQRWKAGEPNDTLDRLYPNETPTVH
jgi:hypothetical protein